MTFIEWLRHEIEIRGWQVSDLARKAELSSGTLSRILSQERNAGPEVCVALARALGVPPELVFRRAGLLPEESEDPSEEDDLSLRELVEIVRRLPKSALEEVLNYALFRARFPFPRGNGAAANDRLSSASEAE